MAEEHKRGLSYVLSLTDKLSEPLKGISNQFAAFEDTLLAIGSIGTAFAGATAAIGAFVDSNLTALDEIYQLQNVTGVAADKIYEWGKVAEVNGSSSEAAQASIEGLSKVIGEASLGLGKGAKAFEQYGLTVKKWAQNAETGKMELQTKNAIDVMEDLRQKMQGMAEQEQIAMLSKLGIDKTMIQTLRLSNAAMDEAQHLAKALSLGVGNPENAEAAAKFKDALTLLQQVIKGVGEYISVKLAPHLTDIMDMFKEWYVLNNHLVQTSLENITQILGNVLKFIFKTIRAIDRILQATIGWDGALWTIIGTLAILKRATIGAFLANPVTAMTAGILAMVLLVEDLIVYMKGGKSYFGKAWEPLAATVRTVSKYLQKIKPLFNAVVDAIKPILPYLAGIVAGGYAIKGVFLTLAPVFSMLKTAIKGIGIALRLLGLTNPFGLIITAVLAVIYYFRNELGPLVDGIIAGFSEWGVSLEPLTSAFGQLWELTSAIFAPLIGWLGEVLGLSTQNSESFRDWTEAGKTLGEWLAKGLQNIIKLVAWVLKSYTDMIRSIYKGVLEFYNWIASKIGAEPIKIPVALEMPDGVELPAQAVRTTVLDQNSATGQAVVNAQKISNLASSLPSASNEALKAAKPAQIAPNNAALAAAPIAATLAKPAQIAPIKGANAKSFAPVNNKNISNLTQNNQKQITNYINVTATTNATPAQIGQSIVKAQEERELQ